MSQGSQTGVRTSEAVIQLNSIFRGFDAIKLKKGQSYDVNDHFDRVFARYNAEQKEALKKHFERNTQDWDQLVALLRKRRFSNSKALIGFGIALPLALDAAILAYEANQYYNGAAGGTDAISTTVNGTPTVSTQTFTDTTNHPPGWVKPAPSTTTTVSDPVTTPTYDAAGVQTGSITETTTTTVQRTYNGDGTITETTTTQVDTTTTTNGTAPTQSDSLFDNNFTDDDAIKLAILLALLAVAAISLGVYVAKHLNEDELRLKLKNAIEEGRKIQDDVKPSEEEKKQQQAKEEEEKKKKLEGKEETNAEEKTEIERLKQELEQQRLKLEEERNRNASNQNNESGRNNNTLQQGSGGGGWDNTERLMSAERERTTLASALERERINAVQHKADLLNEQHKADLKVQSEKERANAEYFKGRLSILESGNGKHKNVNTIYNNGRRGDDVLRGRGGGGEFDGGNSPFYGQDSNDIDYIVGQAHGWTPEQRAAFGRFLNAYQGVGTGSAEADAFIALFPNRFSHANDILNIVRQNVGNPDELNHLRRMVVGRVQIQQQKSKGAGGLGTQKPPVQKKGAGGLGQNLAGNPGLGNNGGTGQIQFLRSFSGRYYGMPSLNNIAQAQQYKDFIAPYNQSNKSNISPYHYPQTQQNQRSNNRLNLQRQNFINNLAQPKNLDVEENRQRVQQQKRLEEQRRYQQQEEQRRYQQQQQEEQRRYQQHLEEEQRRYQQHLEEQKQLVQERHGEQLVRLESRQQKRQELMTKVSNAPRANIDNSHSVYRHQGRWYYGPNGYNGYNRNFEIDPNAHGTPTYGRRANIEQYAHKHHINYHQQHFPLSNLNEWLNPNQQQRSSTSPQQVRGLSQGRGRGGSRHQ